MYTHIDYCHIDYCVGRAVDASMTGAWSNRLGEALVGATLGGDG
jgi:hypothetical protein